MNETLLEDMACFLADRGLGFNFSPVVGVEECGGCIVRYCLSIYCLGHRTTAWEGSSLYLEDLLKEGRSVVASQGICGCDIDPSEDVGEITFPYFPLSMN